jgi:hypothetical protein
MRFLMRASDANHVLDSTLQNLRRQPHIADLRHPRIAARAAVLEHQDRILLYRQFGVIDASVIVLNIRS